MGPIRVNDPVLNPQFEIAPFDLFTPLRTITRSMTPTISIAPLIITAQKRG
jgi:hypothetical protein